MKRFSPNSNLRLLNLREERALLQRELHLLKVHQPREHLLELQRKMICRLKKRKLRLNWTSLKRLNIHFSLLMVL
jgi:hypothetical protein